MQQGMDIGMDMADDTILQLYDNNHRQRRPDDPSRATSQYPHLPPDEANRPVICEYSPDGVWLWAKYAGTVLELTISSVLAVMALSGLTDIAVHVLSEAEWDMMAIPPATDSLVVRLQGVNALWQYQLTLSTFILTFFTQEVRWFRGPIPPESPTLGLGPPQIILCSTTNLPLYHPHPSHCRPTPTGGASTSQPEPSRAVSTTSHCSSR